MKSQWIEHSGKRILFIDVSNFGDNEKALDAELAEVVSTIGLEMYKQPAHSVLVMVNLTNTDITQTANRLLSERIKDTKKFIKKTAVVGMTGVRSYFLEFFAQLAGSETGGFHDVESAKAWLVK